MKKTGIGLAILALFAASMLAACGATAEPQLASAPVGMPMVDEEVALEAKGGAGEDYAADMSASDADDSLANVEQMIIWNASISLTVEDTKQAMAQVQALARELGGRTVGSESWVSNDQLFAQLTIRVPAEKYEDAMVRLRDVALEVNRESASSEDVTDQYVDLESRLRHLEAKEEQLLGFLEDAEDTEAVLAVYEYLAETQAEIEHVKGRMGYLEELSAMATISVELHPEEAELPVVEEGWEPGRVVRDAARALVNTLEGLVDVIIWFSICVLPILLVIVVPLAVIVRVVRRRRRSQRQASASQEGQR
jgi:hypothetical protein